MSFNWIDILPRELETEFTKAWNGDVEVTNETDFATSRKEN